MKAYRLGLSALGVCVMACGARVTVGDLGDASFDHPSTETGGSGGAGGTTGTGGAGADGGQAGSGGSTTGTGGLGGIGIGGSGGATTGTGGFVISDARISADAACAADAVRAVRIEGDLYMMADTSGSMDMIDPGQTVSRWENLAQAIPSFVNDPANAGIEVGLDFFPEGGLEASCNEVDYTMANVPIDFLPGMNNLQANAIISAVQGRMRAGGTPTVPALTGALQAAKTWQMNNPRRPLSVLLLTDGQPTGCQGNTVASAATVAQMYATGTPPIKTYVVSVGLDAGNLDAIAAAGGTTTAYLVRTGAAADVAHALAAIRKNTQGCDFNMPQHDGGTLDPNKINVEISLGTGGVFYGIYNVGNAAGCGDPNENPTVEGWYYDNPPPAVPTKIILCPKSCNLLQVTDGSSVNLLLGCTSQPPPR
jgi:hypothetical protein